MKHLAKILFIMLLVIVSYLKCDDKTEEEPSVIETFCEREGQTICQAYCSPVSFKSCKNQVASQGYEYCCLCEFFNGEFKNECIQVSPSE